MIQNHQRNSQVIIIINQLYADRHCGINVAIRESATATDKERKLCEASHGRRGDKKDTHRLVHVHHINNNELAIHFSYTVHTHTYFVISRFVACIGNWHPQFFFSWMPTIFLSPSWFSTAFPTNTCCSDISLPISQDPCICMCYCFLCFHLKMINRCFLKWARTITFFSGVSGVCLCVAFLSAMNFMHLLEQARDVWSYLLSPTYMHYAAHKEKQPDWMIDIIFVFRFYMFFLSLSLCGFCSPCNEPQQCDNKPKKVKSMCRESGSIADVSTK